MLSYFASSICSCLKGFDGFIGDSSLIMKSNSSSGSSRKSSISSKDGGLSRIKEIPTPKKPIKSKILSISDCCCSHTNDGNSIMISHECVHHGKKDSLSVIKSLNGDFSDNEEDLSFLLNEIEKSDPNYSCASKGNYNNSSNGTKSTMDRTY